MNTLAARAILIVSCLLAGSAALAQSGPTVQFSSSSYNLPPQSYFNIVPQLIGFAPNTPVNCVGYSLPPFMSVDPNTCAVFGTAPYYPSPGSLIQVQINSHQAMIVTLTFQVINPQAVYDQSTYSLIANSSVDIVPNLVGIPYGQTPNCTAFGLPPGLTIDPGTCAIAGQLPPLGATSFQVSVNSPLFAPVALTLQILPETISYSASSFTIYANTPTNIVPQLSGIASGAQLNCFVQLPPGLQIDPETCAITGQAMPVAPPGQTFNVSIQNSQTPPVTLTIQVIDQDIVFANSTYSVYSNNSVNIIPQLVGFNPGESANCWANGLPPGLQIDTNSCAISGIAGPVNGSQTFTVTISSPNSASGTITLSLQVISQSITYTQSSYSIYANAPLNLVSALIGFAAGQSPNCFAANLPPGLQIDPNSCAIAGTPTELFPSGQIFNVTVQAAGVAPQSISFTLLDQSIQYSSNTFTFYSGSSVSLAPQLTGFANGLSASCLALNLPPGLHIDLNTCTISGIPAPVGLPSQSFLVTVSSPYIQPINLTLQVVDQAVVYGSMSYSLFARQYTAIVPTLVGFAAGSNPGCTASGLPTGLSIDSVSCQIFGTPIAVTYPSRTFNAVVFAPGVTPVNLTFQVSDQTITYSAASFTVHTGVWINIVPTLSGYTSQIVPGCSASGLPPGLYVNSSTCAIYGEISRSYGNRTYKAVVSSKYAPSQNLTFMVGQ
jgi:hypothetical protein